MRQTKPRERDSAETPPHTTQLTVKCRMEQGCRGAECGLSGVKTQRTSEPSPNLVRYTVYGIPVPCVGLGLAPGSGHVCWQIKQMAKVFSTRDR